MKVDGTEASPVKAVVEELDKLREQVREIVTQYAARVEAEIDALEQTVRSHQAETELSASKLRDLRDMLTVLRNGPVKSGKGRRKDLKKLDSVLSDLNMLVERW
jgi:uncharacterized coiled-coil DUF342 family protein